MEFNEEFDKKWKEAVDEYETIPDKSKIKEEDREFARGFYYCLWLFDNVNYNYKDELDTGSEIFDKLVEEIATKYDKYAKEYIDEQFDELLVSILDSYVE